MLVVWRCCSPTPAECFALATGGTGSSNRTQLPTATNGPVPTAHPGPGLESAHTDRAHRAHQLINSPRTVWALEGFDFVLLPMADADGCHKGNGAAGRRSRVGRPGRGEVERFALQPRADLPAR